MGTTQRMTIPEEPAEAPGVDPAVDVPERTAPEEVPEPSIEDTPERA